MSTNSEALTRPKSKAGEWTSFALLGRSLVESEGGSRGEVSEDSWGTVIMVGFGLKSLIDTIESCQNIHILFRWQVTTHKAGSQPRRRRVQHRLG